MQERASDRTYRATNDLHFSSWTESNRPFAFDLPTGLAEQDGIFYFVEHADGDHELVVPSPPPLTRSRLTRPAMNPQHFVPLRCR